jgi:hypothetical protein
MLTVKRPVKMMTNKYRLLFKKIGDYVILRQGTPCIKKYYVNKREIVIKNRPVFVLFSKLNSL